MKIAEIRDLADDELRQRMDELYKEQFELKQQQASGKLDHPLRVRSLRRDIARIKTVLKQKQKTV